MRLLVFPLNLELKAFVKALERKGHASLKTDKKKSPVYEFQDLKIRCVLGGHGKVQFAVQAQFFLNHFKDSSAVYCIGTSGSLSYAKPLDVVVATETVEHDFNLKFVKREKPRFPSDSLLLNAFESLKPNGYGLHFGPVASGDEDVLDKERALSIHKDTGALVVAWEGAGGARACRFLGVPYLEIRAVSDLANESAPSDFKGFLEKSMENIADLVIQIPKN